MADNYLEKRMEELRSGRLTIRKAIPGIKPGAKRVLIVGGTHGEAFEKAMEFRKKSCRVAIFDPDEQTGRKMAYENGVRYHHVDPDDKETLKKEILSLLNAWRGVDVIVGTNETNKKIGEITRIWKENLPVPDKSDIDFVII